MKCISHDHIDAVGQCNTCWWWLCKECMKNFLNPICPSCNLNCWESRKKEILSLKVKLPLYAVGIGFVITMINSPNMQWASDTTYITFWALASIVWVFIYFWWIWINDLNANQNKDTIIIKTDEGIIPKIIGKVFKLIFAWIIGIFVWPYKIYQLLKEYKESLRMIDVCKKIISNNTNS